MHRKDSPSRRDIAELKGRLRELSYLGAAIGVLNWDQEVNMPKRGADARAASISLLSGFVHRKFLEIDADGLLSKLKVLLDKDRLDEKAAAVVRETGRSFARARKFSEKFVTEMAELTAKSQSVWAEARAENDFGKFAPSLERIVEMKREEAKILGYEESPYDALLDEYEPRLTVKEVERIFADLKSFLIPLLARIRERTNI